MNSSGQESDLTILGAGIAGLSAGYYAKKAGIPFTILESKSEIGGNCRTIARNGFRFDTGAHRFHDKDAAQTRVVRSLLGDEIREISTPSQIYHRGQFIAFPLSLTDLARRLGIPFLFRAAYEAARARLAPRPTNMDFEDFALRTYGKTIAELFLLGYSQKLWGVPPRRLSPIVSGERLKGLTAMTLLRETLGRGQARVNHLDGSFYYPQRGIQAIPESLGRTCGRDHILTSSRVTRVFHDDRSVRAVEVNGRTRRETDWVVSSLPLPLFLALLDPPPPSEITALARRLRFRNLLLSALFLDRPSVSAYASIYFPDSQFPFSRIYEPKNRSRAMSPLDQTALIAEFPCQPEDSVWQAPDQEILERTGSQLAGIGLIRRSDIFDGLVVRMDHAYPVIENSTAEIARPIFRYLERFENLRCSGRAACFEYVHIHGLMRKGYQLINEIARVRTGATLRDAHHPEHAPDVKFPLLEAESPEAAPDIARPEIE